VEKTLQHYQTAQRLGLPLACAGNYHPNRPEAGHALTFKRIQSMGMGQLDDTFRTILTLDLR